MKSPRKISLHSAAAILCLLSVDLAPAAITLSQAKLGNVFLTTETVQIPLTCGGNEITWIAKDFFGATVGQGSVAPQGGSATIQPNLGRKGYFDLEITEKNNGSVVSQKITAFAVVTAIDISGMANSPFGVMTHFAQYNNPDVLPLFSRGGFAHIRDEQYWNSIETQPGQYNFSPQYTNYMSAAAAQQITPLVPLTWSNQFYDYEAGDFTAPHSDLGRTGYSNYAIAVLNRYGSQIKAVEIWNEYNGGTFVLGPATANKPYYYYLMLRHAYQMMKVVRPDITVLGGGVVPIAHGFFKGIFDQGAMPYLDVASIHPYREYTDALDLEITELRDMIKSYNGGQEKPIWATEFNLGAYSAQEQVRAATYLAQITTVMLSQRVERMYYYLGVDDGNFPFWGLVSSSSDPKGKYTPHPTYVAYANVVRQLYGATYQSRFSGMKTSTYAYKFSKAGETITVLWSAKPVTVSLAASAGLVVTDIMGQETALAPNGGSAALTITENPQFVRGPVTGVSDAGNTFVADSLSGYSKTQGLNGWFHGYANKGATDSYSPSEFQPMTWGIWSGNTYCWLGTSTYHFVSSDQVHPSGAWAIRRWVSNVSGTVTLSGRLSKSSGGDGVNLRIFVEGSQVYSKHLNPDEDFYYSVPNVTVSAGQRIDFTINQGGENSFDSTRLVAQVVLVQPQTHALTVNNGSGDGSYAAGTSVTVTADAAPAGQQFAAWTGDTAILANASLPSTTATMPAAAAAITATYGPAAGGGDSIRYFPRTGFASRMAGGIFEGTNGDPNTGTYSVIHTISTTPPVAWTEVSVSLGNFRYLRYRSPNGSYGNVAEIEFYRSGSKVTGTGFGTPGSYNNEGNTFAKALDGNTATYFDYNQANVAYVGIDGGPVGYALTVNSGSGDGSYAAGTAVTISADSPPAGQIFAGWTGNTPALSNASASTTTVTMPAAAVTVTATYAPVGGGGDKIRYYPRSSFADRMVGGVFEGTNGDPVTGPYTALHTISAQPPVAWTEVTVSLGTYRYLRYRSPNGSYGNVAEIEFYRGGSKLTGSGYGTPGSYNNEGNTFAKALDGNTASFFDYNQGNGAFVGIDAGPFGYSLTVNSGSGDGNYPAGTVVTVSADAAPAGQQFAGWTGDTAILSNPTLATTSATMPALPVSITATFSSTSAGGLPSPWTSADIGSPLPAGSANYNTGTFTVQGGGVDIWDNADSFHFVSRSLTGDGTIVAKVQSVGNTHAWAKAGVMVRSALTAGASNAYLAVTPGGQLTFQRRTSDAGSTINTVAAQGSPRWVRITRSGNSFTAAHSADGVTWTTMGSETIVMPATVQIGLAVTSHSSGNLSTAVFSNVTP